MDGGQSANLCGPGKCGRMISILSISTFLVTVFLSLNRFQGWLCGTHVLVQMDSTTVMHRSEQGRRDQVQDPGLQGLGDYSVVSEVEDLTDFSPYFGPRQRRGGLPLSSSSRESSPVGTLHRMVSGPHGDFPSLRYLGPTYSCAPLNLTGSSRSSILSSQTLSHCQGTPCRQIGPSVYCTCILPAPPVAFSSGGGSGHCDSTMVVLKRMASPGPAALREPVRVASSYQSVTVFSLGQCTLTCGNSS